MCVVVGDDVAVRKMSGLRITAARLRDCETRTRLHARLGAGDVIARPSVLTSRCNHIAPVPPGA